MHIYRFFSPDFVVCERNVILPSEPAPPAYNAQACKDGPEGADTTFLKYTYTKSSRLASPYVRENVAFSPASAPPENLLSNTGAAPRPFRLRPVPAKREKNRPVASAVGLFERASLFVESSQIILHVLRLLSPRVARRVVTGRFFRALTWAAAFSLCFVSLFWLAKKRNEASNAARSYRRKIVK